jgi:hypothetical protein
MEIESLQPQIDEAQKALGTALDEACARELDEVDTGELIRIEESLAVAIKAAKQAVSLRLRRRNQRTASDKSAAGGSQSQSTAGESPAATHRIFDDIRGKRWHVFAVHPSTATVERVALPPSYRDGWLSFKSNEEIRRVAPIPDKWEELSIDDLRLLCYKAGASTSRVKGIDATLEPKSRGDI